MHVGLNLIFLVPGKTGGMEVVARELIPALRSADPSISYTAFVNRELGAELDGGGEHGWLDGVRKVVLPINAASRAQWVLGEQLLLPRAARRAGADLVHSLGSTAPARGKFKRVVTIHDLIHRFYPGAHFGARSVGIRVLVSLAARRSDRVIADSFSTRDDLVNELRLAPERIDVAHLGVRQAATTGSISESDLRRRHRLGDRRIILTVSAKRPHKNLPRLLEALASIAPDHRPLLVMPGYTTPEEDRLGDLAARLGLTEDVRMLGWISEQELDACFAASSAFVFPSLYEGFGLPVLEAMQRGVPVACSNTSSLPELVGDAAVLFDPTDPRAIAAAIETLLDDPVQAERLRERGFRQAANFTWAKTAEATLATYRRAWDSANSL